jgi:hypothetical protein
MTRTTRTSDESGRARDRLGRLHAATLLGLVLSSSLVVQSACRSDYRPSTLPTILSDEEFWRLSTSFSEPAGAFTHSENLVSNETQFVHMIRMLRPSGGVYIGVGPEQNFNYIARLRPAMAFIVDIRRENRNLHLMYKALFELSADRADFVSRLFSRERPARVGPKTPVQDLFAKYETVRPAGPLYEATARLIRERILDTHEFPLSAPDLDWIEYAFNAFYSDGPDIHYGRSRPRDSPGPSYRVLMTAVDTRGENRSYLASEEGFAFVKDLHARNMIVPIVGDFAGVNAIRRAGDYIRHHDGIVNAFYGSNVEVYLNREEIRAFCGNLATLPYGSRTWFIGSKEVQPFRSKLKSCAPGAP